MGRSKVGEEHVRKLHKTGGTTYAVTLPVRIIRDFNWQERQKVVITEDVKNKRIIIEDWKG